ncbi:MAG: HNH endonuclease [Thiogranum sp.]
MMFNNRQELNRQRLLGSAAIDPDSDCWLWRGQISNSGYGKIMLSTAKGRAMESAHRASYLAFVGPIPEGTFIRQSCGKRLCINPEHLEVILEKSA